MSWRNTDYAYGSRSRGLQGLGTFAPPGSTPTRNWREWERAYGNFPKGLFGRYYTDMQGMAGVGLGDCSVDPDTGETFCSDPSTTTLSTGGGYFGTQPTWFPTSSPGGGSSIANTIANDLQVGFNDAYGVLKLLNPVPAGCTVITRADGSQSSSCASNNGLFAAPGFSSGFGSSSGLLLLLALGAGVLFLAGGRG